VQFFEKSVPKADAGHAVGLFLIAWGIFTAYMFIRRCGPPRRISTCSSCSAVTFFLLGIGNAGAHPNIIKAGGWVGLATAAAAWYASFRRGHQQHIRPHRPAREAAEPLTRSRRADGRLVGAA
jgi:succinate-acetate transporter protein